jgi:lipopolysaccharide/colanic/teichoic acid biosynthesis glycosyltransferase
LFDFFLALIGLIVLGPLFLIIAILVSFNGPLFFIQERYGKDEKIFKLWKFRTMKDNFKNYSIEQLRQFESSGNDPRVNKLGKFLRKYALDELPQLINILKGDMSFVGPRAYFKKRVEENEELKKRLKVKPGLTCLVAINGGVNLSDEDILKLDLEYINKKSFFLDIKILLKSIFLVIIGKGFSK